MKPIEFKTSGFGKSIDEIHQFFCLFNDDKKRFLFILAVLSVIIQVLKQIIMN